MFCGGSYRESYRCHKKDSVAVLVPNDATKPETGVDRDGCRISFFFLLNCRDRPAGSMFLASSKGVNIGYRKKSC